MHLPSLPNPSRLDDALQALYERGLSSDAAACVDMARDALTPSRTPGLGGPADVPDLAPADLAAYLDHTQLRPEATDDDIDAVCAEAREHGFATVCVPPNTVADAADLLATTDVGVCTVVGFPHGTNRSSVKAYEATQALRDGATEVDMVLPIGRLKSGRFTDVETDIRTVVEAVSTVSGDHCVKVILETALLTDAEIAVACVAAQKAGADFVKTSTGFASTGATLPNVALMRQMVGDALGVKAAGGVGSAADARQMIAHGATRIGASGSVGIVTGAVASGSYGE